MNIFFSDWWLDATAGEGNWGVCKVSQDNEIVASMPWTIKTNLLGMKTIAHPPLTQTLGPWLADPPSGTKYAKRLAREKDLMEALIHQLPDYHIFRQNFAPEISNWLPFYWKGFQQTTRYTYRLPDLSDIQALWSGFQDKIRTDIRKAEKQGVTVERCTDINAFLDVNELTFLRQNIKLPYTRSYVKRLFAACERNNAGAIFLARGKDGRVHAGNLLVWNQHCAYYLMGGGDPELRTSGATSLAMWQSIQFAATVSHMFDFEGSMIESVERFFRGFGAVQTPYFSISHVQSRWVASVMAVRSLAKVWL
ncbi:GNAT family N-acetyltransferase [Nodularia spumigena CS-586/05]|uniref:GNAT family N-acetyltransferase n=1 Tax=Nodularia spumigena TaxID=70799 RepID=UPI002330C6C2|nr:GNAT family N-acetyltransferase [Nodularia spumigena]MDB9342434.1 GNAT family N-acetyltransferase [Nodularia spumigena CS-588/06]MDB9371172.1 GNAT family N-acetyltransferase [Nodularia spumigena CS-586/05]